MLTFSSQFNQDARLASTPRRIIREWGLVIAAKSRSSSAPTHQALDGWPIKYKLKELTSYSSRGGERTRFVRTTCGVIGKTDAHRPRGEKKLRPRHGTGRRSQTQSISHRSCEIELKVGIMQSHHRLAKTRRELTWGLRCMIGERLGRCQDTRRLA
jgi:hypothetical protein